MTARFEIDPGRLEALRAEVDEKGKLDAHFCAEIRADGGELVAEIEKVVQLKLVARASAG